MLASLERAAFTGTKALSVIGLAALLLLASLTLADGLGRWAFNAPIEGVRDIGGMVIAVAVACCLPMGLMERGHISVDVIAKLGKPAARITNFLASLIVAITMALMAWQFLLYAQKMAHARETTWVLQIPIAPFWFGVDFIVWCAVLVQAIVVALDFMRMVQPSKVHGDARTNEVPRGEIA